MHSGVGIAGPDPDSWDAAEDSPQAAGTCKVKEKVECGSVRLKTCTLMT